MLGRFRAFIQDEGYTVDTIGHFVRRRPSADFDARMKALSHTRTLEEASALAAANKRVSTSGESHWPLNDIVRLRTERSGGSELVRHLVVLRDRLAVLCRWSLSGSVDWAGCSARRWMNSSKMSWMEEKISYQTA